MLDFDMIEETSQIFNEANTSDYQLTSQTITNPSTDSAIVDDNGDSITLINRTVSINQNEYTNVVYYFDTLTSSMYFSVVEG